MEAIREVFARAVARHQAGDLAAAERLYRRILRIEPFHAEALHLLGVVHHQQGDHKRAVETIGEAISLVGPKSLFCNNLGAAYRALGMLQDAIECYQQSVQLDPDYAQAHFNLGLALLSQTNLIGATSCFQQAVRIQPGFVAAWNSLGNAFEAQGDFEQAAGSYQRAVGLSPGYAEASFNLGNVRLAQGRLTDAIACYSQSLRVKPDMTAALNNLGTALCGLGQFQRGIESYQLAVRIRPEFDEAHNNLGTAFGSLGLFADAERCYREAQRINPANAAAWNNLGAAFHSQSRWGDAAQAFREALRLAPTSADARGNLAGALQSLGEISAANDQYVQTFKLQEHASAWDSRVTQRPAWQRLRIQHATMLPPIYDSVQELRDWRERFSRNVQQLLADRVSLDPAQEQLPVNFYLAYQGENDRELMQSIARLYGPFPVPGFAPQLRSRRDRRLRIGFLSKYFTNHTIGTLTHGLIANLSRTDFHVTTLSVGSPRDPLAELIRQRSDASAVVSDRIPIARKMIVELDFDILFYSDIGMDPVSSTLAHSRLAPVQCVTWGHPVTTGIPTIDYFLSSNLLETGHAESHYSESLVRLPTLPAFYSRPTAPPLRPRAAFGLPDDAHVYLCPQSLFKFHPEFDSLLRAVLERDPRGVVAVIEPPVAHWKELLTARLRRSLGSCFSRLIFAPRQDPQHFPSLLAVCDVMLDPPHFGGGNTTYQGFALGTPIVSLPSAFLRGRVTAACYQKMGISDCLATSPDDYVNIAVRLGTDVEFRQDVRQRILRQNVALFEDHVVLREMERFFKGAVEKARDTGSRAA